MKKKIISFIGLLLFVGVVAFNMQMVSSNDQANEIRVENIEALASSSGECCAATADFGWQTETPGLCSCPDGNACFDYSCIENGTFNECNEIYCPSS